MDQPTRNAVTRKLARFAVGARDFGDDARQLAVDATTDCLACILAATRQPLVAPLLAVLPSAAGRPDHSAGKAASVIGLGRSASVADAALINGTLAHALDYDDINHPGYAHPSACLVPAMLAVAELVDATGAQLVDGYIVGLEAIGKLGGALNQAHYKRGWHATGTLGSVGAAVSAGRVLGLDEARMAMAIGLASSSASGLQANFGTMTKPLHAGMAARNGVLAALLVHAGFTSSPEVLESRGGYLAVFQNGAIDWAPLDTWGVDLAITSEYGLALKAFPCCGATHTAIDAALTIRSRMPDPTAPLARIRIGITEIALNPLLPDAPTTPLEAKFNIAYCVAAAIKFGEVRLSTFTESRLRDIDLIDMMRASVVEVDDRLRSSTEFASVVRVETVAGEHYEELVWLAPGKPARRLGEDAMWAKFCDCWQEGRGGGDAVTGSAHAVFDALRALDSSVRIRSFTSELAARL